MASRHLGVNFTNPEHQAEMVAWVDDQTFIRGFAALREDRVAFSVNLSVYGNGYVLILQKQNSS